MGSLMVRMGAILCIAAMWGCHFEKHGVSETITQSFEMSEGSRLRVENANGRIRVVGWDQPSVDMTAVKKATAASTDSATKRLAEVDIETDHSHEALVIRTIYQERKGINFWGGVSVHYELKVPHGLVVEIVNTNGDLDVSDLSGRITAGTTNGDVRTQGLRGSLKAYSTNGDIDANVLDPGEGAIDCSTTNGGITLSLPGDVKASLSAKTVNGKVRNDLAVETEFHSKNTLKGTVNGGGPAVTLRTVNGSIRIKEITP